MHVFVFVFVFLSLANCLAYYSQWDLLSPFPDHPGSTVFCLSAFTQCLLSAPARLSCCPPQRTPHFHTSTQFTLSAAPVPSLCARPPAPSFSLFNKLLITIQGSSRESHAGSFSSALRDSCCSWGFSRTDFSHSHQGPYFIILQLPSLSSVLRCARQILEGREHVLLIFISLGPSTGPQACQAVNKHLPNEQI